MIFDGFLQFRPSVSQSLHSSFLSYLGVLGVLVVKPLLRLLNSDSHHGNNHPQTLASPPLAPLQHVPWQCALRNRPWFGWPCCSVLPEPAADRGRINTHESPKSHTVAYFLGILRSFRTETNAAAVRREALPRFVPGSDKAAPLGSNPMCPWGSM